MNDAIGNIINEISDKCHNVDDTYINTDGILMCSKCESPRQCFISFRGKTRIVNCLCKCLKQKADEEAERMKENERQNEIRRNLDDGIRDRRWKEWMFDSSDYELTKEIRYCEQFGEIYDMNAGIMFLGDVGTGKTFRASCIANRLIRDGYRVLMDNITSICMDIQKSYDKREYIDSLNEYDLLILDDIGAERRTEFMIELVYNVIDSRYRCGKPLIITSNLSLEELTKADDIRLQRTYDRIMEMCSYPIVVTGEGRRRKIGNDKYKKLKGMLG